MEDLGIYTVEDRKKRVGDLLGTGAAEGAMWALAPDLGPAEALSGMVSEGAKTVIVDDAALMAQEAPQAAAEELVEALAGEMPSRIVFLSEQRDAEDPLIYQLVSECKVVDLAIASAGHDLEGSLPEMARKASPAAASAHWLTEDRAKLRGKRRSGRKRRRGKGYKPRDILTEALGAKGEEEAMLHLEEPAEEENAEADPVKEESMEADPIEKETVEERPAEMEGGRQEDATAHEPEQVEAREAGEVAPEPEQCEADEPAPDKKRSGAAALMQAALDSGLTAPNRAEDPESELTCPTAREIYAVGAASRGIGCTQLACAAAMELARAGAAAACAIWDPATFDDFRRAVAPSSKRSDRFEFAGVVFYRWEAERPDADLYDVVVCDCGVVGYPDDDPNSPAALHARAASRAVIVSAAPWLLQEASDAITSRKPESVADTDWFVASAGNGMVGSIRDAAVQAASGRSVEVRPAPWRPELMTGDKSRLKEYGPTLLSMRDRVLGRNVTPEEFARRREIA